MNSKRLMLLIALLAASNAFAGGPLVVGGPNFGKDGQPFIWNPANMPIKYTVDVGPLSTTASGAVVVDNATGVLRVQNMFNVWHSVPTAAIAYSYDGPIRSSTGAAMPDVSNIAQFNDVSGTCDSGTQNPVIFDANGTLMTALGLDSHIIGIAGQCKLDAASGYIVSAQVVMNGKWLDGSTTNFELSPEDFNAAITHELGHFSGLGHSQVNVQVKFNNCTDDLVAGLPLMFPVLACQMPSAGGFPVLSPDDVASISKLYPNAQTATSFGTISGTIFFSDGVSQEQGVNVIARSVDDLGTPQNESLRIAVSSVSGYLFTWNPGQKVSGKNDNGAQDGSRNPALIGHYEMLVPPGTYTVEIEAIDSGFIGGSSVGPLPSPVALAGAPEFWNQQESAYDFTTQRDTITVHAGDKIENINIIQNGTQPQFDQFEDTGKLFDAPLASPLLAAGKVIA